MKTLKSGIKIPDRLYYYLLDFNDETAKQYIWDEFRKESLHELTMDEIISLTNHAMLTDLNLIHQNE